MASDPATSATGSCYSLGKAFGRKLLKPYRRDQMPVDLVETVYVPVCLTLDLPPELDADFVRGAVEATLCFEEDGVVFSVMEKVASALEDWLQTRGLQFQRSSASTTLPTYRLKGTEALDFLALIYDGSSPATRDEKKYERYLQNCGVVPHVRGCLEQPERVYQWPTFKVVKKDPGAILPSKKRASDQGFDLTVIRKVKDWGPTTALYDTGLIIQPPPGYYVEIVPRSSLAKSGYLQSNSVGIIDPSYLDTLKCPLTKVDPTAPDLQLPFTGFQLLLRRMVHGGMVECSEQELAATARNTGGFGSTGGLNQHRAGGPTTINPDNWHC